MQELDNVIKGLNDAVAALKVMIAKARQATANAELLAGRAKAEFSQLDVLRAALDERDEAISIKESAILSAEELAKEKDNIEVLRATLANERQEFSSYRQREEAKLVQRAADLDAGARDLLAREKALVEEQASYKEKLLADITKKMGF